MEIVYNESLINKIKDLLIKTGETVAVAESVTAGHLQAALSLAQEASKFYQGGITAYNLGQKARHLHINPIVGERENCVHEVIADRMAVGVTGLFSSDYGLSITGYATPAPQTGDDGLFAFFSIAENDQIVLSEKISIDVKESAFEAQVTYTNKVLQSFYDFLTARN